MTNDKIDDIINNMNIIVCDTCGYEAKKGDTFYEKLRCTFIDNDETYPEEVMERLCQTCEGLL